jgi:hypothetical protein
MLLVQGLWIQALSLLTKRPKLIKSALIAIAAVAIAFGSYRAGISHQQRVTEAGEITRLASEVRTLRELQAADISARAARYDRDTQRIARLETERRAIDNQRLELTGKINETREATSGVYLSVGAVRLLNDARQPATPAPEGSAGAPAGLAYANPEPSTVDLARVLADGVDVATRYRDAQTQCNALIEWVNTELVPLNKAPN